MLLFFALFVIWNDICSFFRAVFLCCSFKMEFWFNLFGFECFHYKFFFGFCQQPLISFACQINFAIFFDDKITKNPQFRWCHDHCIWGTNDILKWPNEIFTFYWTMYKCGQRACILYNKCDGHHFSYIFINCWIFWTSCRHLLYECNEWAMIVHHMSHKQLCMRKYLLVVMTILA